MDAALAYPCDHAGDGVCANSLIRTTFPLYKRLFFNQCFLAGMKSLLSFLYHHMEKRETRTDRACTFVQEEKGMHHFNREYIFKPAQDFSGKDDTRAKSISTETAPAFCFSLCRRFVEYLSRLQIILPAEVDFCPVELPGLGTPVDRTAL